MTRNKNILFVRNHFICTKIHITQGRPTTKDAQSVCQIHEDTHDIDEIVVCWCVTVNSRIFERNGELRDKKIAFRA